MKLALHYYHHHRHQRGCFPVGNRNQDQVRDHLVGQPKSHLDLVTDAGTICTCMVVTSGSLASVVSTI